MIQSEEKKNIFDPEEIVNNMSKPAHSDFLIYWIGRDFDEDRYVDLTSSYSSKTSEKINLHPHLHFLFTEGGEDQKNSCLKNCGIFVTQLFLAFFKL